MAKNPSHFGEMVRVHELMDATIEADRLGLPRPPRRRPRSRQECEDMVEMELAMREYQYQAENRRAAHMEARRIFNQCGAGTDAWEEAGIPYKAAHIGRGCTPVPGFDEGYNSALIRCAEVAAAAHLAGPDVWAALMREWFPFGNVVSLSRVLYYDK